MKPFKIYENFRKMTRKNASNIYEVNIANILHHVGYVIHLCIVFALIMGQGRGKIWHKNKRWLPEDAPLVWTVWIAVDLHQKTLPIWKEASSFKI